MRIGEFLIKNGVINKENLKKALDRQKNQEPNKMIGEIMVELGMVSMDTLIRYLEIQRQYRATPDKFPPLDD